jgi:predicted DsbA family dithiol-disulfide isomerase
MLQSDEGIAEVKAEEATGHKLGIRGVPHFIVNGTYAISGAKPSGRFVETLKQVERAWAEKDRTAESAR